MIITYCSSFSHPLKLKCSIGVEPARFVSIPACCEPLEAHLCEVYGILNAFRQTENYDLSIEMYFACDFTCI